MGGGANSDRPFERRRGLGAEKYKASRSGVASDELDEGISFEQFP
jgi:hypothetical protein